MGRVKEVEEGKGVGGEERWGERSVKKEQ